MAFGSRNPDPIGSDKEDYTYRFFWTLDTKEMYITVFDIKDVIAKASRVSSSNVCRAKTKPSANRLGPKKYVQFFF